MLSRFSIKKPLTIVVIIIIILILGVVSYLGMQEDLLPDMNLPYIIVVTVYAGAQPDVVEREVTVPLEEAFASVSNINRLNSVSAEHYSLIIMELTSGTDLDVAKNNLQDAIALTALPSDDMRQDPIIVKIDPSMLPIMRLSVGYDTQSNDERTQYLEGVIEKIGAVEGVASVSKSGLIDNFAYLDADSAKTAEFFTGEIGKLLDVDFKLSKSDKENVRKAIRDVVEDAKTNPDLQTDGEIDPEKVLDEILDNLSDYAEEEDAPDAVSSIIKNVIVGQLGSEGPTRDAAIAAVEEVLDNAYILEDGEENKKIFYALLDELTVSSANTTVKGMLTSVLDMFTEDIYKQVIYAQDMNYPAGSLDKGALSFVVKVGDTISSREQFLNMPVFTFDVAQTLQDYISRLELILRMFAATTEDGKVKITDESLHTLAEYLSYMAETTDDYGKWVVDNLASENTYSPYYMNPDAREKWQEMLNAEYKDDAKTERNELYDLVHGWDEVPYDWRTKVLTCVKDNKLYPAGEKIADEVAWDENYTEFYTRALSAKYENLSSDKPDEDNVGAYADYVIDLTTIGDENKAIWKDLLLEDANFNAMVTEVSASDTLDWQLCAITCVTDNAIYPSSWGIPNRTLINTTLNAAAEGKTFGKPSSADGYARLAVNGVAVSNSYLEYYLDADAKEKWVAKIVTDADFLAMTEAIGEKDDYMLMTYRFLNEDAQNYAEAEEKEGLSVLFPTGEIVKGEKFWGSSEDTIYGGLIDVQHARFQAVERVQKQIMDSLGEKDYKKLVAFFAGRTAEENYDLFIDILDALNEFAGEGAVEEEIDEETKEKSYLIDLRLIESAIENSGDKLKITIHLTDLCDVTFLDDVSKQITKLVLGISEGEMEITDSIQLSIDKEPTAASAEVTKGVRSVLADLSKKDTKFSYTVLSDDGKIIGYMLDTVVSSLLIGGLLALLILIFFLKDIKATLVIGSSILISVVVAIVLMYFTNISLNVISLGGLTLGVGMLVDNSVVVLENTYRLRSKGYTVMQSAAQGANQMLSAILGSTITTVVVFLPILFVEGLVKEIFVDFALTICFSLGASLFVSMTVVPAAYNTFMAPREIKNPDSKWGRFRQSKVGKFFVSDGVPTEGKIAIGFKKAYLKALNFVLNHKVIALILVVVLFVGSVFAALSIGTEYFPDTYMGYISVQATINPEEINSRNAGLTYENDRYFTREDAEREVVETLIDVFANFKDIESVGISQDSGLSIAGMDIGGGKITAIITLVDEKKRSMDARSTVNELAYAIERKAGKLFSVVVDMYSLSSMIDMGTDTVSVYVYGNNYTSIQEQTKILAKKFSEIEGVTAVDNGIGSADKEYRIIVDKDKASLYGLTVGQAYLQVSKALGKPSSIHELNLSDGDGSENISVLVYDESYLSKYWYKGKDEKGKDVRVYFRNNVSETGDNEKNEYYVNSPFRDSVYVKNAKGEITTALSSGNIALTREGNTAWFEYAEVKENEEGTHDITYKRKTYTFDDEIKYYTNLRADIDLVTLKMRTENILDPNAETATFPLYKILSEACLVTDADGNILYRESATDAKIPVGIKLADGYTAINHIQYRECITMTVGYDENVVKSGKVKDEINNVITEYNKTKPASIEATTASSGGIMDNVFENLYIILGLAIVLVFLVMVAQFQSWKSPFIIMGTIVLAFTGSFYLMAITATKISIMSLIGLIVLMGVVVNNGIVFVDYANSLIERGMSKREALLKAGNDRIRPILMTAITTVLGMIAMAADGSDYGAMLQPLAIAMIGGLSYATLMTLFIVPSLYDVLNRRTDKRAKRALAFRKADLAFVEEDSSDGDNGLGAYILELATAEKKSRKKSKRNDEIVPESAEETPADKQEEPTEAQEEEVSETKEPEGNDGGEE